MLINEGAIAPDACIKHQEEVSKATIALGERLVKGGMIARAEERSCVCDVIGN